MFDQRYFSVVYQSWIFKNETVCLCRGKQLTFSLLQLSSGSEKRTRWLAPWASQARCTGTLAIIPAPGCAKNSQQTDYFFSLLETGSSPPFFPVALCWSSVCLPSDPSFPLSMLFYIIGASLCRRHLVGSRNPKRGKALPPFLQESIVSNNFSHCLAPAQDRSSAAPDCVCDQGLRVTVTLTLPFAPPALGCLWLPAIAKALAHTGLSSSSPQLFLHQNNQFS